MATNPDPLVPVSTFIEALAGVLSDEEQAALAETLSIPLPQGVAPGDLITAELFNGMLVDIQSLAARVETLESASSSALARPEILTIRPDPVSVGEEIEVVGRNLNPELLTAIFVGRSSVPLSRISEGSPGRLVFPIPAIDGVVTGPVSTTVRIDNRAGNDSQPLVVTPAENDVREVTISLLSLEIDPEETIQPNTTYELSAELRFTSTVEQTYRITPSLNVSDEVGNWSITPNDLEIPVPLSNDVPFVATLNFALTTGDEGAATITIAAEGVEFAEAQDSTNLTNEPITVEEDVVLQSSDIILQNFSILQSSTNPVAHFNMETFTLSVLNTHDSAVRLSLDFLPQQTGAHQVDDPAATGGWAIPQPDGWTQGQAGAVRRVTLFVTAGSGAGTAQITVTGPAGTEPFNQQLTLARAGTLPTT